MSMNRKPPGPRAILVVAVRKKTDAAEYPRGSHRVGLLSNEPPGVDRAARHLVFREFRRVPGTECD